MKRSGYLLVVGFVGFGCFSAEDLPLPPFYKPPQPDGTAGGMMGAGGAGDAGGSVTGPGGMDGIGVGGSGGTEQGGGGSGGTDSGYCGDGIRQTGEVCDNGVNGVSGGSCTSTCDCGIDSMNAGNVPLNTAIAFVEDSSCYVLVSEKKNWDTSKNMCEGIIMHLAYVKSVMELEAINPHIVEPTWVGAHQPQPITIGSENWNWLDGTNDQIDTTCTYDAVCDSGTHLWGPLQPNNSKAPNGNGPDQDCAEIFRSSDPKHEALDGRLNDFDCATQRSYLCEAP